MKSLAGTIDLSRTEILAQDDASPEYIGPEILGPPVKTERNEVNLGFGANCNAGARRAKGDYLLFLNQDCLATRPGWLDELLDLFQREEVGLVGPKLLFPDGSIQSAGGLFDAGRGPFHRYLGWTNKDDRRINHNEVVSWLTGAAIMIRRADFEALGGFDEAYQRGYFEDVDLSMRVRHELGKEVWYCPFAELVHRAGSAGGVPAEVFKANSMRFHAKWDKVIEPDVSSFHVSY